MNEQPYAQAGMRVATDTRISTDEEPQPYSLEAQAERLSAYIRSQEGWELSRRFTDLMTGSSTERPGLQRALAEARARRFDLLLVYRVDRLARSVRGLAQILEELDKVGVVFRSATEPFDTATPAGRMMVQMLGVFAEFERATLIDRVIAGMERKAARGGWNGGAVPFGYLLHSSSGALALHPERGPLVAVIFDLYLHKRLGSHAVADWLNRRGHRTASGRPWSYKTILTLLRNRAYLGEVNFRGRHHPTAHPALVDAATFTAVQAILAQRGEDTSKRASNSSDYLLTGLVRCCGCGNHFAGTSARGKRARYHYYTCQSRLRYGRQVCSADRLPAPDLDQAVVRSLLDTLRGTDLIEQGIAQARQRALSRAPRHREELAAVEIESKKTEEALPLLRRFRDRQPFRKPLRSPDRGAQPETRTAAPAPRRARRPDRIRAAPGTDVTRS